VEIGFVFYLSAKLIKHSQLTRRAINFEREQLSTTNRVRIYPTRKSARSFSRCVWYFDYGGNFIGDDGVVKVEEDGRLI